VTAMSESLPTRRGARPPTSCSKKKSQRFAHCSFKGWVTMLTIGDA